MRRRAPAMKKMRPRKLAATVAAVAATAVSVLAFPCPANALASAVKPQAVTYYQYKNNFTGKCLAARRQSHSSPVQQMTCDGSVSHQWTARATGGGYFQLAVANSGKCMEVE